MTKLDNLNPCSEAKEWVKQFNTFQEAWQSCDRVDWMLWLLNKLKLPTDQLARQFAYHVLHIYEEQYPNDRRLRTALENPTKENIAAAWAAEQAANKAAWAAQDAAWTAWTARTAVQGATRAVRAIRAARAAAEAAAQAAAWAAQAAQGAATWAAAQGAAWAAIRAAAWVATRADERQWQCDQIRFTYPVLDVEL